MVFGMSVRIQTRLATINSATAVEATLRVTRRRPAARACRSSMPSADGISTGRRAASKRRSSSSSIRVICEYLLIVDRETAHDSLPCVGERSLDRPFRDVEGKSRLAGRELQHVPKDGNLTRTPGQARERSRDVRGQLEVH